MKRVLFIVLVAFIICQTHVQGQGTSTTGGSPPTRDDITYDYDNAGNRILRQVITIIFPKLTELDDEEFEEEFFTNDFGVREIVVYPNPVKIDLTIEILKGDDADNYRFQLFDMSKVITYGSNYKSGS
jgi:hypothetical protein